jgi:hypothetical protein
MTNQNRFGGTNLQTILKPGGTEESNMKLQTCSWAANQHNTIFGRTVSFHENKYPGDFLMGEFYYV